MITWLLSVITNCISEHSCHGMKKVVSTLVSHDITRSEQEHHSLCKSDQSLGQTYGLMRWLWWNRWKMASPIDILTNVSSPINKNKKNPSQQCNATQCQHMLHTRKLDSCLKDPSVHKYYILLKLTPCLCCLVWHSSYNKCDNLWDKQLVIADKLEVRIVCLHLKRTQI